MYLATFLGNLMWFILFYLKIRYPLTLYWLFDSFVDTSLQITALNNMSFTNEIFLVTHEIPDRTRMLMDFQTRLELSPVHSDNFYKSDLLDNQWRRVWTFIVCWSIPIPKYWITPVQFLPTY